MARLENMIVESILDRPADLSVFEGGWEAVSVLKVPEGESRDVSAIDAEVFLFVLDGEGKLQLEDEAVDVRSGMAVSLALRTRAALEAINGVALRVFYASVRVDDPDAHAE